MTQTRCATRAVPIVALVTATSPEPAHAQDCGSSLDGPSRQVAKAGGQVVVFATRPWPVPVGRPFHRPGSRRLRFELDAGAGAGAGAGAAPRRAAPRQLSKALTIE